MDSIDELTKWYAEIQPEFVKIKKSINFINKTEIELLSTKIKPLNLHLSEKNSCREIISREASALEADLNRESSNEIFEKLKLLNETATKTEQQCKDLDFTIEKTARSAGKYFESKMQLEPWLEDIEEQFSKKFDFNDEEELKHDEIIEELSLLSEDIAERRLLIDRIVSSGN